MPRRIRNKLQRTLLAVVAGGLAVLLAACGGGGAAPGTHIVVPDTTKVLDSAGMKALVSVDASGTLTFGTSTAQLAALAPGDVLVIGRGTLTPDGLLRTVDGVNAAAGTVTVVSHQATLADAIEQGHIELHQTLQPSQALTPPALAQGVRFLPQTSGPGFAIGLNGVWLDDSGKATASGTVSAQPTIDVVIDIDNFSVTQASVTVGGTQAASLALSASYATSLTRETSLYSQLFPPIPIAGSLPIYLIPKLDLVVGAGGSVSAATSTSIGESASIRLGVGYVNGSFGPIAEASPQYQYDPPTLQGAASASVYAGPRLNLTLDGLDFVRLDADGHVDTHAQLGSPNCTDWSLAAGIRADVGLTVKLLDITLLDYQKQLLDETKTLDSGSQCGTPPPAYWARSFGGASSDGAYSIDRTPDGGSIVLAQAYSFSPGTAWLVKLGPDGSVAWQEVLDGAGVLTDVQAWGNGYVLAGNDAPSLDATVVRLDGSGKLLWAHGYGSDDGKELAATSVRVTSDGGLLLGGSYGSFSDPGDMWAAKLDPDGTVSWSKRYGGTAWDYGTAARPTPTGYVLVGTTDNSFDAQSGSDVWVVTLGAGGAPQWQRRFGGPAGSYGTEYGYDVQPTSDGGYIVAAATDSFASTPRSDGWLLKLDAAGAVTWAEDYDAGTDYDSLYAVREMPGGGYLAAGTSGLGVSQSNLWALRVTANGGASWSKTYGGAHPDEAGNGTRTGVGDPLVPTAAGGALLTGTTSSFGTGGDAWALQVPPTGALVFGSGTGGTVTSTSGAVTATPGVNAAATNGSAADVPTSVSDLTGSVVVTATHASALQLAP